jgi:hypothetical protein
MFEIFVTEEFEKKYSERPSDTNKKAEKQERLFCQNPCHPSFQIEKSEPKKKHDWIDKITF